MKLLHAADLHVDSPLRGLSRYPGCPEEQVRGATRRALEGLVDLARSEDVDAVLLAGDVFDGDWPDYNTGLFFSAQMQRLREAGIPVYLIKGNHDAASQVSRRLQLPDNVRELPVDAPGTVVDEERGLAVHGQGFVRRAVTDNLALAYPPAREGLFNVGLLHTALDGRAGHDPYAPCTLDHLVGKGYDYWALGHVHARDVVSRDPYVVFPGNLQGRSVRETGPKGATLVTVEDLRVRSLEHRELDVVRWARLEVDAGDLPPAGVLDRVEAGLCEAAGQTGGRLLAVRVAIRVRDAPSGAQGGSWARPEDLRAQVRALATGLPAVWVEKVVLEPRPPDPGTGTGVGSDALADLLVAVQRAGQDVEGLRGELRASAAYAHLPPAAQQLLELEDPAALARIVAGARSHLQTLLAGEAGVAR